MPDRNARYWEWYAEDVLGEGGAVSQHQENGAVLERLEAIASKIHAGGEIMLIGVAKRDLMEGAGWNGRRPNPVDKVDLHFTVCRQAQHQSIAREAVLRSRLRRRTGSCRAVVSVHSVCGSLPPFSRKPNGLRQDARPRLLRLGRHPFSMIC